MSHRKHCLGCENFCDCGQSEQTLVHFKFKDVAHETYVARPYWHISSLVVLTKNSFFCSVWLLFLFW